MSFDSSAPPSSLGSSSAGNGASSGPSERKRKRKSRWAGGEDDKTFIPGMPTMLPQGLNKDQEQAYLCKWTNLSPDFSCIMQIAQLRPRAISRSVLGGCSDSTTKK